jgi:hypothetical protein
MFGHSLNGAVVVGEVGGVHAVAPADPLKSGIAIAAIATAATAEAAARKPKGRFFMVFAFSPNVSAGEVPARGTTL